MVDKQFHRVQNGLTPAMDRKLPKRVAKLINEEVIYGKKGIKFSWEKCPMEKFKKNF